MTIRPPVRRGQRGAAILLTLAVTSLMLVLITGILSMSLQRRREATGSDEQIRVRAAADTAVQTALATIRQATSTKAAAGTPAPWTSQPGAIRVHAMDGTLRRLFKLYTSAEMTVTDAQDAEGDVPQNWHRYPEQYVDLNAPLLKERGNGQPPEMIFPVLDPRARTTGSSGSVEGFDYSTARGPAGTAGPGAGPEAQRLPMPVQWIYQLEDGGTGVVDSTGRFHGFDGAVAMQNNAIVARFAYWTDDESCKININTAAEGAFWDTPRADTRQERQLASNQPVRAEYHRQPGHSAGVCLSSVLLPGRRFYPGGFPAGDGRLPEISINDARALWNLGRLAAADEWRSTSLGGLQAPVIATGESVADAHGEPVRPPYDSVAELLYGPAEDRRYGADTGRKPQALFQSHPEAARRLARSGFFLTADSAAPETTMFGTPRIALWPVHGTTDPAEDPTGSPYERATAYDRGIARVSTIGGRKYYVQRLRPGDGAWDFERANRGENKALLDYLRTLTARPFPGWERPDEGFGTFAGKYGPDREGILLSMLDYVRAANFSDGQLSAQNQFPVLCPGNAHEGFGQVSPLSTEENVRAIGRMMTVSEVALLFSCRAQMLPDGKIAGEPSSANRQKLSRPGDREIEIALLLEAFVPSHGWADHMPYVSVSLSGGPRGAEPDLTAPWPAVSLNGTELQPLSGRAIAQSTPEAPQTWAASGGTAGVRPLTERFIAFRPVVISAEDVESGGLRFSGAISTELAQWKLAIYDDPGSAASGRTGKGDLVQVIPLEVPPCGVPFTAPVPVPSLPPAGVALTLEKRLRAARQGGPLLTPADVVQSLVPAHGDYRLLAAQSRVEAAGSSEENAAHPVFVTHPQWGQARFAHSLREPATPARSEVLGLAPDQPDPGNPAATGYQRGLSLAPESLPDAPFRSFDPDQAAFAIVNGRTVTVAGSQAADWNRLDGGRRGPATPDITGDFDNGLGNAPDGPYVNRPDDGNLRPLASGGQPYFSLTRTEGKGSVPPVSPDVFSAQRMFPSPVAFGSLPTGAASQVPWQTLLFRPQEGHYGAGSPPDHLLLDLFWSPVLEPEPHSRALETAGKINLNHPIVPFGYIRRATALHAAMKAETLMAIPDAAAGSYKTGSRPGDRFRHFIDPAATLALWDQRVFRQGRVFLTPGEICGEHLIPEGSGITSVKGMEDWWAGHRLTGDNTRERPYADLYPRLTTRSNVFKVHFIAESLQKDRMADPAVVDLSADTVTARIQGSCIVRRELDTDDPDIPDYTRAASAGPSLESFYRWRVERWTELR